MKTVQFDVRKFRDLVDNTSLTRKEIAKEMNLPESILVKAGKDLNINQRTRSKGSSVQIEYINDTMTELA